VQVETNYLTLAIGLSVVDSVGLPLVLESSQITMPFNKLREKNNNKRKERKQIIYNIVSFVVVVVSHQITKRQQYFIVSWMSTI
jgi:hypothetical protein